LINAPIIDIDGQEALQITIVMASNFPASGLEGRKVVDTMVKVHDRLQEWGEERFPFVNFATEDELENSAAP